MSRLRAIAGALVHDWLPFEANLRRSWVNVRNRNETLARRDDAPGREPQWRFTTDLHIANVFPSTGARLLRRALRDWPIEFRDDAVSTESPELTFVIGHRGASRLPLLLQTLRSIAAQRDASIECIVVEQSATPEVQTQLPAWVRYVHATAHGDYSRAAAFNAGASAARGRVLVLHDNDILVPSRYAAEVLRHAAAGRSYIDLKRFLFNMPEGTLLAGTPTSVMQNAEGGSIAMTRAAYEAIGGFDESFVGWGGEDNELRERADWYGGVYRFGYLPMVHLYHPPARGKADSSAPAVRRYYELAAIPAGERVSMLLRRRSDD
jgi:hypothetical protein